MKADRNGAQLPARPHHPSTCIFPKRSGARGRLIYSVKAGFVLKQTESDGVISQWSDFVLSPSLHNAEIFDCSVDYSILVSTKKETSGSRFSELKRADGSKTHLIDNDIIKKSSISNQKLCV